jgi:2'-5' RNA ligase
MLYGYRQEHSDLPIVNRFALVIFLPERIESAIAPLREKYDPDYAVISSHVTLVSPFETDKPINTITRIVRSELDSVQNLKIDLHSIGDFYPDFPIIYWGTKSSHALDVLYKSLYAQLEVSLPYKSFAPHVAVAREISDYRVMLVKDRIVGYLPDESFIARTVDLVAPVAGQNWVSVRTFPLRYRI